MRLAARTDLSEVERDRLRRSLKTLGSATSYGIFAQMDRQESDKEVRAHVLRHRLRSRIACNVKHPEAPGEYCFPPLASLITSGGASAARAAGAARHRSRRHVRDGGHRLDGDRRHAARRPGRMSGRSVSDDGRARGDSRAIVGSKSTRSSHCFDALNPYDRAAVAGLDPQDRRRQLRSKDRQAAAAVVPGDFRQALRTLFLRDRNGEPELLRKGINNGEDGWSRARSRTSAQSHRSAQARIAAGSRRRGSAIVRRSLGLATEPLPFDDRVALGQITVSSPEVLRPLAKLNAGKAYAQQIKPFNFILSCHVAPYRSSDRRRSGALSPHRAVRDRSAQVARAAMDRSVFGQAVPDQHLGPRDGTRQIARVKSYGDVLEEYEFHEEAKCADASGEPCGKQSVGAAAAAPRRDRRRRVSSARSRTSSKRSRRANARMPATCTRSIPIRGATNG